MLFEILVSFLFSLVISDDSDLIKALPGLAEEPKFKQYSGYLNGGQDIRLHYWFVESQGNPKSDPVILWLNGGPGESSLWGMFHENGPFRVGSDGQTVTIDPNSWNTLANVLYLESPVGVGFSYLARNETFKHNDIKSARMNLKAIQDFFAKFSQFKDNRFYITGESYGGTYAPMLALEILKNVQDMNLKGVAIGNGYVDSKLQDSTNFEWAYHHGVVDEQSWNKATLKHCKCSSSGQDCDFSGQNRDLLLNFYLDGINPYNLHDDLCSLMKYNQTMHPMYHYGNGKHFKDCPPDGLKIYMNSADVRKALNIHDHVQYWRGYNPDVMMNYETPYIKNMTDVIKEIIAFNKLDQFIFYNGDLDLICDFIGGQRFVERLGYPVKDKQKVWRVNGHLGGTVKRFEGITFTTALNAGHSVPMDRPEAGLAILKELIGIEKLN